MGQRFVGCDREQSFLMPPDVREWLPDGHLAWFVIDAVGEMDLAPFYGAYRVDGRSRPAYDPAMMVALLLYAYSRGIRSSRVIEGACDEDVAFRVLAARGAARSRDDRAVHRAPPGVGVIAVDGTKVPANASRDANRDYERIAREILEEAKAVDAAEDELYGDARGDELPEQLRTGEGRRGSGRCLCCPTAAIADRASRKSGRLVLPGREARRGLCKRAPRHNGRVSAVS